MNTKQVTEVHVSSGYANGAGQVWFVIDGKQYKVRADDLLKIVNKTSTKLEPKMARVYEYVEVV